MTVRGMDSDNYDGDVPESHFKKLHDQYGVSFNIIGLEARMPFALSQRQHAEAAGIVVPFTYKFLYWRDDDLDRMKEAAGFGLPVAIDCEAAVPGWSHAQVVGRISQAKDLLIREGQYWGIYTGEWWWPGNTGNSTLFAGDKLWHAAYPYGAGKLPPESFLPTEPFKVNYGGWTKADVHQYADVCYGDNDGPWDFDMNAANESILGDVMEVRHWAYGNEAAGEEIVGNQIFVWHLGVVINKIGDEEGLLPGKRLHNEGGVFVEKEP